MLQSLKLRRELFLIIIFLLRVTINFIFYFRPVYYLL